METTDPLGKQKMKKSATVGAIAAITLAVALLASTPTQSIAAKPLFGSLYYDDEIVRTLVPPAETDKGLDDFYSVSNGAEGQLGIAAEAPGDKDYHGGHWIVNTVTFNEGVTTYLLTSEEAVLAAYDAGDVSIERNTGSFLCPIQP